MVCRALSRALLCLHTTPHLQLPTVKLAGFSVSFASLLLLAPLFLLSCVGVTWDAKEVQESMKSHGQPSTSSSPGDGRSTSVALPSSLSPAEQLQEEHPGRITPGTLPVFLALLLPVSCIIQTISALIKIDQSLPVLLGL